MILYNPLSVQFDTPIYFFTSTILNWKKLLLPDKHKFIITDSLKTFVESNEIILYAFVIMPNHIHLLFSLFENCLLADFKRDFLKFTAQQLKSELRDHDPLFLEEFRSTQSDRYYQIWERRPRAFPVYNEKVFFQKLNYIHNNPVQERWKLVDDPVDYYFSSAKFYDGGENDWPFVRHYRE